VGEAVNISIPLLLFVLCADLNTPRPGHCHTCFGVKSEQKPARVAGGCKEGIKRGLEGGGKCFNLVSPESCFILFYCDETDGLH
jgi:hypothetical protein